MISVRENTGKNIVSSMGIKNVSVAPDPTLLMPYSFFDNLADQYEGKVSRDYTYCFFIRNMKERKSLIKDRTRDLIWNNDLGDSSVESWLYLIKHANSIITDSFHCVVMCLKFHIPFVVITELNGNVGMNDRFYTLLTPIKMVNRILYKNSLNEIEIILSTKIDWNSVDMYLNSLRNIGKKFLNF
jgi:exopolysaccharide biosynthesis predicted pyruvyltransferase EpsI